MKLVSRSMLIIFRKITIVALLVLAIFIIAYVALLHMLFVPLNAEERPNINMMGNKWVSEDGNISFSSYEKMLVLTSDVGKSSIFKIEYFGLGSLSHNDNKYEIICQYFRNKSGTFYITFIESEHSLDLSRGKVQVSYTGQKLAELKLNSSDKNNITAVVTYANPAQDYFIVDETICFSQVNDISNINVDEYRLYFDGTAFDGTEVNYADMSSIHSLELTLYTKEEFCNVYGLDAKSIVVD